MQTFLPYPSIWESIECLDYKRLGKQRVEAKQIIDILEGRTNSNAWINHPAVIMWRGRIDALKMYYNYCIDSWIKKGYKNNMKKMDVNVNDLKCPKWWGDEGFHASHRSNLLRKYPEYYGKFGWKEPSNLPYQWPSNCDSCNGKGCDSCNGKGYITKEGTR